MRKEHKILVTRTDRAGDLILTLPVFQALRQLLPDAELVGLVKAYTAPLLKLSPDVDIVEIDRGESVLRLAKRLAQHNYSEAVIVHPAARVILATALARIPVRIGRASNLWQFALTRRMVQHRSQNEHHESFYNLNLLQPLGWANNERQLLPRLQFGKSLLEYAAKQLMELGLAGEDFVIIHPGHGGSAHNFTSERYADLGKELTLKGFNVMVSLGPGEESLEQVFYTHGPGKIRILKGIPDFAHLAAIFSFGQAFVGGSTGPMHLAAVLGLKVAAIFPPQASMTPHRWGPLGERARVFLPHLPACSGLCSACVHRPCMNLISLTEIISWITQGGAVIA